MLRFAPHCLIATASAEARGQWSILRLIIAKNRIFPSSLTRNITSNSVENLACVSPGEYTRHSNTLNRKVSDLYIILVIFSPAKILKMLLLNTPYNAYYPRCLEYRTQAKFTVQCTTSWPVLFDWIKTGPQVVITVFFRILRRLLPT